MLNTALTLILAGANAFAHSARPCAADLATPAVIPQVVQPFHAIEMPGPAGRVYRPGETIPTLKPGAYLYLINRRREVLVAPKYDVLMYMLEQTGLATHKGLLLAYACQMGFDTDDEIVAGGQFRVAYEIVAYLSNKSGNFPAGQENLVFAHAILLEYGLPIVDGVTRILDYTGDQGHTIADRSLEETQLLMMAAVDRNREARAWRDLFERFGRAMLDLEGTPVAVAGAMMDVGAKRNYVAVMEIVTTFGKGLEPDGLNYAIYQGYFGPTALKIRLAWNQVPWYLERLIARHPDLNPTLHRELLTLVADFRALNEKTKP